MRGNQASIKFHFGTRWHGASKDLDENGSRQAALFRLWGFSISGAHSYFFGFMRLDFSAGQELLEVGKTGLVSTATAFRVDHNLSVVLRGNGKWVVTNGSATLNSFLEMELEPLPSSRDDDYISRTRFDLTEAFIYAEKYIEKEKKNGRYR